MADKQRIAHDVVDAVLSGWMNDRVDTFSDACSPDVRWWLPYGGENLTGPENIQRTLLELSGRGDRISINAKIVAEDGETAVVEMSVSTSREQVPTPMTTVIMIEDGCVAVGRTYFDVAAFGSADR